MTTSTPSEFDDRALRGRVAIGSRPETADTGIDRLGGGFELDRERDLVGGRHREELFAPEVELGCLDVLVLRRGGQAVELVTRAERRVVACVSQCVGDDVGVERTGPRVSLALIDDDANTDPLDLRGCERLDIALERVHVDLE